ncbi:MAG: CinA family protein [Candidatus Thermoplasmatota archaeon]|jgi:nicotinamide-nucleotide amidase|nr:CinA family protein [Candidatus Thermoplasmatota archaeon]
MKEPTWELLVKEATERKVSISTAESCTGGYIASRITDVPGATGCFLGGFVVYSNDLKTGMLFVSSRTLEAYGAVSRETVEEMVRGCIRSTGADLSLAVTGVAGPGGGTKDKPAGTVFISVMRKISDPHTEGFLLNVRDRADFKAQVADRALGMLLGTVLALSSEKP